jgi:hypothetical protein
MLSVDDFWNSRSPRSSGIDYDGWRNRFIVVHAIGDGEGTAQIGEGRGVSATGHAEGASANAR